jgi:hypothetical protein
MGKTMSRSIDSRKITARQSRSSLSSILTLAAWRLRQTWWQLLLAGLALVAATMVACIFPLFSVVSTTASLQGILNATPLRSDLTLAANTQGLSTAVVNSVYQRFNPLVRQPFGTYLDGNQPPLVIQLPNVGVNQPAALRATNLTMYATSIQRLEPDLKLVQGNWPSNTPGTFEIMMTSETASALHLSVGAKLTLAGSFTTQPADMESGPLDSSIVLNARLAGIFEVATQNAPSVFGEDFQPVAGQAGTTYTILAPDNALLTAADQWATRSHGNAFFSREPFQLTWYYHLHTAQLQMSQLGDLTTRLNALQTTIAQRPNDKQGNFGGLPVFPYVLFSQFYNPLPQNEDILSLLQQYQSRVSLVSVSLLVLALQIILLLFFFVCLLLAMLIDRQLAMNALLSTRGASRQQVFWSLLVQGFGLCLLALVLGPVTAVMLVVNIGHHVLPGPEQQAIALSMGNTSQIIALIAPYVVATIIAGALAMGLLLRQAVGGSILDMRRELSRSSKQPFWLRYYLDLLAALLAFSGFGTSLYLASIAHTLDPSTQDLIIAPMTLVAPIFLLICFLLLFLRFFPFLLRFFAWCTRPTRGATGMLALVQMARAPRPAMRMTILLALAVSFAFFTLVFDASQTQRTQDVAAYESGADFSGNLPATLASQGVNAITEKYTHVPGVLSATAGLVITGNATGLDNTNVLMELHAVDARTFARTAIWGSQDSTKSLPSLMNMLLSRSKAAPQQGLVPVIVDQATANQLDIATGDNFLVELSGVVEVTLGYQVVAVVTHIPTVNSNPTASTTVSSPGGMLADFTTLQSVFAKQLTQRAGAQQNSSVTTNLPLNYLWLRTSDDEHALTSVRVALNSSQLGVSNLFDRREIITELQHDPLYFNILLMLGIGGATAFTLALVGDLVASWLSVRTRRSGFVVLRALGANSRQIVRVLLWEQALIYLPALVLSVVFGLILAKMAVPVLVFTGLPTKGGMSHLSTDSFYLLQEILPVQVVMPLSLRLAFVGLGVLCVLVLALMVGTALRPSLAQELRLNED